MTRRLTSEKADTRASEHRSHQIALALQLPFLKISESMGNHDSNIVDAGSVD
jgi:hypothetical protein